MTTTRRNFLLAALAIAVAFPTAGFAHSRHSQDDVLLNVHSVLRITGAHIRWLPNHAGGFTPTLIHDISNCTNLSVPVPVTVIGNQPATWAGARQYWIERLGADPTIPGTPKKVARRGRQYAFGGEAIVWPERCIAPRGLIQFAVPIQTGGFPSGRYAITVEYLQTHEGRVIHSQVLFFDVP